MKRLVLLFLPAILVGCLGSDFADTLEGSWQLVTGSIDGQAIPVIEDHPITISFDGDRVGGTASCNSYGGTFDLSGSAISFGDLAMTEMACIPDETMQAEAMYAEALTRVDTASIDEGLTLSGDGVELNFERQDPASDLDLTNTVWVLDGLVEGDSVSTPVSDTRATVEFFTDGSVLGDTGCRGFSGHYDLDGSEVTVSDLASDGHQCEANLTGQDDHFLAVIQGSSQVDIEGSRLSVTQGDNGLIFVSES